MMTRGNRTYHGDHFAMRRNIESLCCAPGTTQHCKPIMLQKQKQKNKLTEKENGFVVTRGRHVWRLGEELDEGVKMHKFPVLSK